jgi:hypothetical protein
MRCSMPVASSVVRRRDVSAEGARETSRGLVRRSGDADLIGFG